MARIALLICLLTFAVQQVSAVNDCVMDYQLKGNLSATGHAGQGGYPNLIQKKGRLGYEGWKPNGADSQGLILDTGRVCDFSSEYTVIVEFTPDDHCCYERWYGYRNLFHTSAWKDGGGQGIGFFAGYLSNYERNNHAVCDYNDAPLVDRKNFVAVTFKYPTQDRRFHKTSGPLQSFFINGNTCQDPLSADLEQFGRFNSDDKMYFFSREDIDSPRDSWKSGSAVHRITVIDRALSHDELVEKFMATDWFDATDFKDEIGFVIPKKDCVMDYQLKGNLSAAGHAGEEGYPDLIDLYQENRGRYVYHDSTDDDVKNFSYFEYVGALDDFTVPGHVLDSHVNMNGWNSPRGTGITGLALGPGRACDFTRSITMIMEFSVTEYGMQQSWHVLWMTDSWYNDKNFGLWLHHARPKLENHLRGCTSEVLVGPQKKNFLAMTVDVLPHMQWRRSDGLSSVTSSIYLNGKMCDYGYIYDETWDFHDDNSEVIIDPEEPIYFWTGYGGPSEYDVKDGTISRITLIDRALSSAELDEKYLASLPRRCPSGQMEDRLQTYQKNGTIACVPCLTNPKSCPAGEVSCPEGLLAGCGPCPDQKVARGGKCVAFNDLLKVKCSGAGEGRSVETFLGTVERNSHNYDTEYGYDEAQEMFWKGYYEGPGKEITLFEPLDIKISRDGRSLYILHQDDDPMPLNFITVTNLTDPDLFTKVLVGPTNETNLAKRFIAEGIGSWASFDRPTAMAMSPDGVTMYVMDMDEDTIVEVDLRTLETKIFPTDSLDDTLFIAVSADGKTLFYQRNYWELMRMDILTGVETLIIDRCEAWYFCDYDTHPSFIPSHDGTKLYVLDYTIIIEVDTSTWQYHIVAGDRGTSELYGLNDGPGRHARFEFISSHASLSPDGKYLYFSEQMSNVIKSMATFGDYFVKTVAGQRNWPYYSFHYSLYSYSYSGSSSMGSHSQASAPDAIFVKPEGVAVSADGTYLAVVDQGPGIVRKVHLDSVCQNDCCDEDGCCFKCCAAGSYYNRTQTNYSKSKVCPHTHRCEPCPKGHFCDAAARYIPEATARNKNGDHIPPPVPMGMYREVVPCPPGTFSSSMGMSSPSDCLRCPVGHSCPGFGNVHPKPCPKGAYCPAGYKFEPEVQCDVGPFTKCEIFHSYSIPNDLPFDRCMCVTEEGLPGVTPGIPMWGTDPIWNVKKFGGCHLEGYWKQGHSTAAGLGVYGVLPRFETRVCVPRHYCASHRGELDLCFVYDRKEKVFIPWAPSRLLKIGPVDSMSPGAAQGECPVNPKVPRWVSL